MGPVAPHHRPSTVTAESGEVLVDGPDGLATALTADAAEETGRRLIEAASTARQQSRLSGQTGVAEGNEPSAR